MKSGSMSAPQHIDKLSGQIHAGDADFVTVASHEIPEKLYIPSEALEIITQDFQGPLDLLLYLIRKNSFDALDIPVAEVAEQYAKYIEVMKKIHLDLAGEYLAMAATLAHIKSRLLLPAKESPEDEEEQLDPRLELAQKLKEYEQIKIIAQDLEIQPRVGREVFIAYAKGVSAPKMPAYESITLTHLIEAFENILQLIDSSAPIVLERETISIKDKIDAIVRRMSQMEQVDFFELIRQSEGRAGVVVTFLAVLELISRNQIYAVQAKQNSLIYLRAVE